MKIWNSICGSPTTNRLLYDVRGAWHQHLLSYFSGRTILIACISSLVPNVYGMENDQLETMPDLEFLEFLGQFETDAGEWIEPDSLLTDEFSDLLEISVEGNTNESQTGNSTNSDNADSNTQ